jgi:hypothetical protein
MVGWLDGSAIHPFIHLSNNPGKVASMKNQKWLMFLVALALMAGTAGALMRLKSFQKIGKPGIMATPIPGSLMMKLDLPENVLDFTSTNVPESAVELGYFPKDTSYARRLYQLPDGFAATATVILMGMDRTSIHKPDYCLPGQGWSIRSKTIANLTIAATTPYELPVSKWVVSNSSETPDGGKETVSGVYVFWFVADGEETPSHYQFMRWLALDLLHKAVWQRWAYVSYFSACEPGQEDATFARMENLITASVPEFQLPPAGR